ncbi:MAG: serine/threonine protein kinase, partial [Clostridiales bacterium]|nr:serine/threonine protein kinase [Clostridiales bacterium]
CGLTQGTYTPSPHHLPPGTVLAKRYLVGRVLGEDGFGITYIGCDLRLEMKVAIKEYFPVDRVSRFSPNSISVLVRTEDNSRGYEHGLEKFLREARVMAKIEKQPQIVPVRDFFEANNTAYIVMEYVEGTNFQELVKQQGGRIPAKELLPLIEPLFSALKALHEAGLIHRDISPDNLMLEQGSVRLLDFGCAREATRNETMTIALKRGYAPIEQYQQKGQGPWTDVYALSATIYYCLTGRVPPQSLDRILEDELVPPRDLGVDLTPGQQKALLKGMAIQPRRRYQSVEELHAGLYHPVEEPEPVIVDEPKPVEPEPVVVVPVDEPEPVEPEPPEPAPVPEPEPDPIPVTVLEPETKDEPAPKTETDGPNKPTNGKLRRIVAAIVAAALVIAIAAISLVSNGGSTEDTHTTGGDASTSTEDSSVEPEPEPEPEPFDGPKVTVANLSNFQAALEDDSVTSINLVGNITWETENGVLEINKAVHIATDMGLLSLQAVVVGEGGSVEIASGGNLCAEIGLIQTKDGGSITVRDGGSVDAWKLWVEQEDDLTLEDGASINVYGNDSWDEIKADSMLYIALSEEELFADATPVTTWDELQAALENGNTQAVKVTSGSEINMPESEWFDAQAPVLIEEGAVLTAAEDGGGFLLDTVLVNRGTLTCDLYLDDSESNVIVNYGTMSGYLWGCSWSVFLNVGQMNLCGGLMLQCTDLVNLGTINAVGEGEEIFFDFRESGLMNFGVWTLEGQNTTDGEQAFLTSTGRFVNWGTLEIGADAQLENYNYMDNYGSINLTEASSTLKNDGRLYMNEGQINAVTDSSLDGEGLITYTDADALTLPENISEALTLFHDSGDGDGVTWVSNPEELESALADDEVYRVVLDNEDVTVSGDLTVNKQLILYSTLTVEGSLTVTGEGAHLSGAVNADSLSVSDGAVADIDDCTLGSLTVEGSAVYTGSWESEASLTLDHSLLVAYDELHLANAEVTLESSVMRVWKGLGLENCSVTIDENSEMTPGYGGFTLSGDSTLTNYGSFEVRNNHWIFCCDLDGTVNNYGEMNLAQDMNVNLNGSLTNYGTLYGKYSPDDDNGLFISGSLNNQGTFYLDGATLADVLRDDGIYSGNDPE